MAMNMLKHILQTRTAAVLPRISGIGFIIFPMPAYIVFGSFGSTFIGVVPGNSEACGGYQSVFSQHGECRKGAVGFFSARRNEVFRPQFSLGLYLNSIDDIGYQDTIFVTRGVWISAHVCHRLKMHPSD
jgi:hypothetical protein